MKSLDRYLLTQCIKVVAGLTMLAMGVFVLERLLKVFELVSNTSDTMGAATRMILNFIPYYLGLALPIALFLGVLITIDRVSRTGELSAALAAGVSLFQVMRPFVLIAVVLSIATFFINGFLQPLGRYDYRATLDRVRQTSFESAFQEGKFARIGDRTFWTEDRSGGDQLGAIFIYEQDPDSKAGRLTTAPSGQLGRGVSADETRVTLRDGQAMLISQDKALVEELEFRRAEWFVEGDIRAFRARGDDERELIITELFQEAGPNARGLIEPHVASATAHSLIGSSVLLLILPFIALPMGLGYGRSFQSTGIAVGVVLLLVIQKSIETGLSIAQAGTIAPWLGIWPIIGTCAALGAFLFLRSALLVATPPLMLLSFDLGGTISGVIKRIRSLLSFSRRPRAEERR